MSDPREVLERSDVVAVVGFSTNPRKAAHRIPAQLMDAGFRVIPVHPTADEILGQRVYRSLRDIPEPVDLVDVFRPAEEAPGIARDAVDMGARALWLQQGIVSPEARAIARAAGLDYVEDRCTGADTRWWGITKTAA